jgi:hypothetical protein
LVGQPEPDATVDLGLVGRAASRSAAYALQELLSTRSDDVLGRVKLDEAIVKGERIPEPDIPNRSRCCSAVADSLHGSGVAALNA